MGINKIQPRKKHSEGACLSTSHIAIKRKKLEQETVDIAPNRYVRTEVNQISEFDREINLFHVGTKPTWNKLIQCHNKFCFLASYYFRHEITV